MVVGKEPVVEVEGEEGPDGSDDGSGLLGYLLLWEGEEEVGEEDSMEEEGEVVGEVAVDSRLVGKGKQLGTHRHTSWLL